MELPIVKFQKSTFFEDATIDLTDVMQVVLINKGAVSVRFSDVFSEIADIPLKPNESVTIGVPNTVLSGKITLGLSPLGAVQLLSVPSVTAFIYKLQK